MHKRLVIFSLTLVACLAMAGLAFAQSCQDVHNPGTNGCAPSQLAGDVVTLTGIVYVVPGTYNSGSTYWQCSGGTGGMTLFDSGLVVSLGDEISVEGTVGAFGSEIQLTSTTVTVLSSGNAEVVTPMASGDLAAGTDMFGDLMSVQGLLSKTEADGCFNCEYAIDDGSGPVIVFVDGTTGITEAALDMWQGDIVKITGATKCFNDAGEILPRSVDDIVLITIPTQEQAWGARKAQFK